MRAEAMRTAWASCERGIGVAHAGVELRQVHVLHLRRAAAGQLVVQMLPRAAERLPRALRFGPQPLAVRPGGAREQLFVELIAIGGDVRQQVGERDVRVVAAGPLPRRAGGHQDRAGQHGRRFEQQLVSRPLPSPRLVRDVDARQQRVERDLLQHETAIVAAVVDALQVPLAEVMVGPLAGRVVEVVGPRIERQLVDKLRIEPGLLPNFRIGVGRGSPAPARSVPRTARGDADILDVERNRPHAFVRVGLHLPSDSSTATGR